MYDVQVGAELAAEIAHRWGRERTATGNASEYDFWSGPLHAARTRFSDFDDLPWSVVPQVRRVTLFDPIFGSLVFVGVLIDPSTVEIVSIDDDPDYWNLVKGDPDD